MALWHPSRGVVARVPVTDDIEAYDLMGNPIDPAWRDGTALLPLAAAPVLLVSKEPLPLPEESPVRAEVQASVVRPGSSVEIRLEGLPPDSEMVWHCPSGLEVRREGDAWRLHAADWLGEGPQDLLAEVPTDAGTVLVPVRIAVAPETVVI